MRMVAYLSAFVMVGCSSEERAAVAPWDFPDGPNPHREEGSTRLPDPSNLTTATEFAGKTPSGVKVTMVSVARKLTVSPDPPSPGGWPIWTPAGGPYTFPEPWVHGNGWGSELDDKGVRYLEFRIEGPQGEATVTGYVPGTAIAKAKKPEFNGWDPAKQFFINPQWEAIHRANVVVEDRRLDRYMFGIATGEWKQVASVPIRREDKDSRTLASGPWGTLRRVAPPPRSSNMIVFKRAMELPTYVVDPPSEPPTHALRVRLLSSNGEVGNLGRFHQVPRHGVVPVVRAVVESRPYEWIEFTGVHYDPEPKLWGPAHWGERAEATVVKSGKTSLEGFILPKLVSKYQSWVPETFFACDGKEWRAYPRPDLLRARFSGGEYPQDALIAVFKLDASRLNEEVPVRIVGYASERATPGEGLLDPLGPWKGTTASRPETQLLIERPENAPFLQFSIQYADDQWTKVGEFSPPALNFPIVKPEEQEAYRKGTVFQTVFSVHLRSYGQADIGYLDREQGSKLVEGLAKWAKEDTDARLVIRLVNGRRVTLDHTSVGVGSNYTTQSYDFDLTADSEAVFDNSRRGAIRKAKVRLRDVEAFEIETRSYEKPFYLVAKLPPPIRAENSAAAEGR